MGVPCRQQAICWRRAVWWLEDKGKQHDPQAMPDNACDLQQTELSLPTELSA